VLGTVRNFVCAQYLSYLLLKVFMTIFWKQKFRFVCAVLHFKEKGKSSSKGFHLSFRIIKYQLIHSLNLFSFSFSYLFPQSYLYFFFRLKALNLNAVTSAFLHRKYVLGPFFVANVCKREFWNIFLVHLNKLLLIFNYFDIDTLLIEWILFIPSIS
jgi:hypothetical protein